MTEILKVANGLSEVLPEPVKKIRTTIYIPISLHKATRVYCASTGMTLSQLLLGYLSKTVEGAND